VGDGGDDGGGLDRQSKCAGCGKRIGADVEWLWWRTHRTRQGELELFCGECEPADTQDPPR
jgi:hypothetical protein